MKRSAARAFGESSATAVSHSDQNEVPEATEGLESPGVVVVVSPHEATTASEAVSASEANGASLSSDRDGSHMQSVTPAAQLPLVADGDAAAGPRPLSDYFEWEIVASPVRHRTLRRSHRISPETLELIDGDN